MIGKVGITGTASAKGATYDGIVRDIRAGIRKPVYYLMGEEAYFIDRIADMLVQATLREEERDFNLVTLFGYNTDIATVINHAKGYPMGSQYRIVIVKEAQALTNTDQLLFYLQQPQPSTLLIFCHRNGVIDKRKKLAAAIENIGVLFESKKYRDYQLPAFIKNYLKPKNISIEEKAAIMLADFVGADLARLTGELDKLIISLPTGEKMIIPDLIERNIGISKEFNYFELQSAIIAKDIFKANLIVKYFDSNPKSTPIQVTLTMLFKYFSKLMLAYYAPQKTDKGIATWVGMTDWQVRENILPAMKIYSGMKVMQIIGEIRKTDAKSKGVNNPNTPSGELLKELIYFILH